MNVVIGLLLTAALATATPPVPVEKTTAATAVEKIPVFLQTDAGDAIGASYVARFRAALEESRAYRPVMNPAHARFVVGILTMDPNETEVRSGSGQSTVAAVTLQRESATGLNQFVYSWVLAARRDTVDSLATELLAAIDKEIQELEGLTIQMLDDLPSDTK